MKKLSAENTITDTESTLYKTLSRLKKRGKKYIQVAKLNDQ